MPEIEKPVHDQMEPEHQPKSESAIDSELNVANDEFVHDDMDAPILTNDDAESDENALADREDRLAFLSTHDELTGLFNRREFHNRLEQIRSYVQSTDYEFSLCVLDLDRFKLVNSIAGHLAGDQLLVEIAELIDCHLYVGEVLGRIGEDEFGLILESKTSVAQTRIQEIVECISQYEFFWNNRCYEVGACVGITSVKRSACDLPAIVDRADNACVAAKSQGRNQIVMYTPVSESYSAYRADLKQIEVIKEALQANRFRLWMQPIEPGQHNSEPLRYEVLLRLQSVTGKLLEPSSFIPAAERYEIMQDVDWWVLRHCLASIPRFMEAGEKIALSINLSANTLKDRSSLDRIVELLQAHPEHSKLLCFEISESAVVASLTNVLDFMNEAKTLGVSFALDDFGSGLSSFEHMRSIPIDFLKINGFLIRNIRADATNRAIVEAFVKLSRALGVKTVAECVEDKATQKTVSNIGVDFVQGFCVARPLDMEQTLARLAAQQHRKRDCVSERR